METSIPKANGGNRLLVTDKTEQKKQDNLFILLFLFDNYNKEARNDQKDEVR